MDKYELVQYLIGLRQIMDRQDASDPLFAAEYKSAYTQLVEELRKENPQ